MTLSLVHLSQIPVGVVSLLFHVRRLFSRWEIWALPLINHDNELPNARLEVTANHLLARYCLWVEKQGFKPEKQGNHDCQSPWSGTLGTLFQALLMKASDYNTSSSATSVSTIFIPPFSDIHSKWPVTIFLQKYRLHKLYLTLIGLIYTTYIVHKIEIFFHDCGTCKMN